MAKNLRQRLGTGIVLAVAGLGSLVTGGCAETQPVYKTPEQIQQEEQELQKAAGLAGSLLFGMAGSGAFDSASRTAQQNLAARGAAAGAQQYQTNDAIRNAGQGNDNNQKRTGVEGRIRLNDSFVCRGVEDLNGDGSIGKNELIEEGNYFKCGKEYTKDNLMFIMIGSVWENANGKNVLATIRKARDGKIRYSREIVASGNRGTKWDGMHFYNGEEDEGVEEWKVDFYLNGRLDSSKSMSFFVDYGQKDRQKADLNNN